MAGFHTTMTTRLTLCLCLTLLATSCASSNRVTSRSSIGDKATGTNVGVENAIYRKVDQNKEKNASDSSKGKFFNATESKPVKKSKPASIHLMSGEVPGPPVVTDRSMLTPAPQATFTPSEPRLQQIGFGHTGAVAPSCPTGNCPTSNCPTTSGTTTNCPSCEAGWPHYACHSPQYTHQPTATPPCGPFGVVDNTPYPEEYLCDGGDRGIPVHYDSVGRQGLDTEDTIAEYQDHTGERHQKVSSRVCVYAPSFGSVRNVSQSVISTSVDKALGAHELMLGAKLKANVEPLNSQRTDQVNRAVVRSRPSQFAGEQIKGSVGQRTEVGAHKTMAGPYEELGQQVAVRADGKTSAIAVDDIQAAIGWTRNQNPVVSAVSTAGNEISAVFGVGDITGTDKEESKGVLKITKIADRAEAKQGETVTFSIEYHNWGDRELVGVKIMDNLTPRLEFIPGSETSDLPVDLTAEDNGEGSVVLQWKLKEDLPGHTTGVITFKCRVR